jgi:hypothetical protein
MQFNLRPTRRPVSATSDATQDAFVAQIPEYARIGCFAALKRVFLNLWAGQALGRNKVFYGPLF